MRLWLLAFSFAILLGCISHAQLPFPGTAPVTFTYRETLKDKVIREPGTEIVDESYIVGTERTLNIQGTAPLADFNLSELDDFTQYAIVIGDFDSSQISGLQGRLSDDENYVAETSTSVLIEITSLNYDGDEVPIGNISLKWGNNAQVEFLIQIDNVNQVLTGIEYGVAADFYREQAEAIDAEDLTAAFSFGPFSYNLRTVYTVGTASFATDEPDQRVPDILSDVKLFGSIDALPPVVTITEPAAGETTASDTVNIFGTVTDKREIKLANSTQTFDGEISEVEVQVSTKLTPGNFESATLDGSNWVLPNATLAAGENFIVVRATDVHGNVTTTAPRKITFLTKGTIEIEANATGFPVSASGLAGTVSASFLPNAAKKITATIGAAPATIDVRNVLAGQSFAITATPAPGAVFNGWTATLDGDPLFTSVDEKLTFETKPNLVLTAEFVPNPFDPVFGIYHGLVTGDNAAERGTFKVAIGKTGTFTGKITAGAVVLPLRGKVLGSGRWEGVVKKRGVEYQVAFQMNLNGAGNRDLEGTLTGGTLTSDFTADLNNWRKPRRNDPGNLATEYVAIYNVLLTPPTAADPLPAGIGYGRVTISPTGGVKFVGKLGDGTPFSAGSILVKQLTGPVFFPFFFPLDKGLGNISGKVNYSVEPETDLTATLDWSEPVTKKVEPQPFDGAVALSGARYAPPAPGGFAILANVNGSGSVELTLPAYTVPLLPLAQVSTLGADATLDPATQNVSLANTPATQGLAFKMKITPKTGLFSGSFKDPQLNKTIPFTGALVQKMNGGLGLGGAVFSRGNKAGTITFGP